MIGIKNTSSNGYTIDFKYNNGLLISKTKKYKSLSTPIVDTYEYNNSNELLRITESYFSVGNIIEFANEKAIKISNPNIKYDLDDKGFVVKSKSISGPSTMSIYKYDKFDMLILHEVYSDSVNKVLYNEFENSKVKKSKMGSDFIDTYKGFPIYKNPFGESTYYTSSISNFTTNSKSGLIEKVYENKTAQTVNTSGHITNEISTSNTSTPSVVYINLGCNK